MALLVNWGKGYLEEISHMQFIDYLFKNEAFCLKTSSFPIPWVDMCIWQDAILSIGSRITPYEMAK